MQNLRDMVVIIGSGVAGLAAAACSREMVSRLSSSKAIASSVAAFDGYTFNDGAVYLGTPRAKRTKRYAHHSALSIGSTF
jgi:succinate dehydrogenase/fumarate reductase flavoprotein subunit